MELLCGSVGVLPSSQLVIWEMQPYRGMQTNCAFVSSHLLLIVDGAEFVFIITVCFIYQSGF